MLALLAEAIDGLVLSGDPAELCEVLRLRDRLNAKITIAAGECHSAELYRIAGHRSLPAMLRSTGMTARDTSALSGLAKKLRVAKQTADAWYAGTLSEGQTKTLAAIAQGRYRERFLANEADIIDTVAPLSAADTVAVVRKWKAIVDAVEQSPLSDPQPGVLSVSKVLDTVELNGTFDAEGGSVIAKAIDQAQVARPERKPARERAEALVEICRFYLAHSGTIEPKRLARRQRPHLNVSVSLDDLTARLPGVVVDSGLPLSPGVLERLLCDSHIHRYLWSADAAPLDYGRSARTAPTDLVQAVLERDGGCRGDNCDRGPEHCEIHHLIPWQDGGETSVDNLGAFCVYDHQKLHRLGITVELAPDGTMSFTNRFGETWQTRPRSQLPKLPFSKPDPPARRTSEPIYDDPDG